MGSWQTGGSFKLKVCSLVVWGETCFHLSNCQNQEYCVHRHWGDSKRLVISQVVWAVLLGPVWECLDAQVSYFPAFPLQLFPLQSMCYCSPPTSQNHHSPISFDWSITHCHLASHWMSPTHLPLWHLLQHPLSSSSIIDCHIHEATIDWTIKSIESSSYSDKEILGGQGNNVCHFSQSYPHFKL